MPFPHGNSPSREARFRDLQARQHGLATAAQLGVLGFSPSMITHRVQVGELERTLPKVYRSSLVAACREQDALAAVLWAGADCVASHATAGLLWRIEAVPRSLRPEVWVPPSRRPRHRDVVVHRGVVVANDRRVREGIPLTSPARTVVDLAARLDAEALEAAVEDVLCRGLTTPGAIERCVVSVGGRGRDGVARLRRLLAQRDQAPLESRLEVKVWRLLRDAGCGLSGSTTFAVMVSGIGSTSPGLG